MDLNDQLELEELFNKNQATKRIRQEVEATEHLEDYCLGSGLPYEFVVALLVQMELHKRADISTLVGLLYKHFANQQNPFQTCADALVIAAEAGFIDWSPEDQRMVITGELDPKVRAEIDKFQYPLPMVVRPKEVKSNRDTGMHSELCTKGSLILKNNHHEDDICLDHINRVNSTQLMLNGTVVRLIQNSWANLDKKKDGETDRDLKKRQAAFQKYDAVSRDVLDGFLMMEKPFYLTHKYDKRGRTYAQGYHVNPQGNDWNKAVVAFAEKEVIYG